MTNKPSIFSTLYGIYSYIKPNGCSLNLRTFPYRLIECVCVCCVWKKCNQNKRRRRGTPNSLIWSCLAKHTNTHKHANAQWAHLCAWRYVYLCVSLCLVLGLALALCCCREIRLSVCALLCECMCVCICIAFIFSAAIYTMITANDARISKLDDRTHVYTQTHKFKCMYVCVKFTRQWQWQRKQEIARRDLLLPVCVCVSFCVCVCLCRHRRRLSVVSHPHRDHRIGICSSMC